MYIKKYNKYKNKNKDLIRQLQNNFKTGGANLPCIYNYLHLVAPPTIQNVTGNMVQLNTLQDYIERILSISDRTKNIILMGAINQEKKNIDDELTKEINDYIVNDRKLVSQYIKSVVDTFKDFDSMMKRHNIYLDLQDPLCDVHDNKYYIEQNRLDTNEHTKIKSYFVFKGGNVIKYWTARSYLYKRHNINCDLDELLKYNMNNEHFDKSSDYDFQLYVEGDDFDNNLYRKLLCHVYERIKILRKYITQILLTDNRDSIKRYLSPHRLDKLSNFIRLKHKSMAPIDIDFINTSRSFILTKYDNQNYLTNFYLNENTPIGMSFNNIILTNTKIDFDLIRLKLNFKIKCSDTNAYSSELFDLSILRPIDKSRTIFCQNVDKYTNIISFSHNDEMVIIRIYSVLYLLKDLLSMLFITNTPNNSIFLWADAKFDKRVIRMGYLSSIYLETNLNHIKAVYRNNSEELNLKNICSHIYSHNSPQTLLYGNFIIDLILCMSLNKIYYALFDFINNPQPNININEYMEIVYATIKSEISMFFDNNNIDDGYKVVILEEIYYIFNNLENKSDLEIIDINDVRSLINENKFFHFMLSITLIYIKKIFLSPDVEWCNKYFNDAAKNDYDINFFRTNCVKYFKELFDYTVSGLDTMTCIFDLTLHTPNFSGGGAVQTEQMQHNVMSRDTIDDIKEQKQYNVMSRDTIDDVKKYFYTNVLRHKLNIRTIVRNVLNNCDMGIKKYVNIGKKEGLYVNCSLRKYTMYFENCDNKIKYDIDPKVISYSIYTNEKKFNTIVNKQIKIMNDMINK
jgi:hypothetical protein